MRPPPLLVVAVKCVGRKSCNWALCGFPLGWIPNMIVIGNGTCLHIRKILDPYASYPVFTYRILRDCCQCHYHLRWYAFGKYELITTVIYVCKEWIKHVNKRNDNDRCLQSLSSLYNFHNNVSCTVTVNV